MFCTRFSSEIYNSTADSLNDLWSPMYADDPLAEPAAVPCVLQPLPHPPPHRPLEPRHPAVPAARRSKEVGTSSSSCQVSP